MTKLASLVLSGLVFHVIVAPAGATSIVIAGFMQASGSQDFVLTSTALVVNQNDFSVTVTGHGQISFTYMVGGTPFGSAQQFADLSLTATSIVTGHCVGFPNCISPGAPFTESGFSGSFAITRDMPFSGQSNLLSGTFNAGAQLTSAVGSFGGTLEATSTSSNPNQVAFSSDFLNFASTTNRDATFNLSSLISLVPTNVNPDVFGFGVMHNTGSDNRFPENFTGIGTGTFSEAIVQIPAPSTLALLASALLGGLFLWQRKRRLPHR
jgi:PEP-CTERM motif